VLRLLHRLGYSLQANAKVTEGTQDPDRDAQFRYLNDLAAGFIADDQPVMSVDTKKKVLIGDYANRGRNGSLKVSPNASRSTISPTGPWENAPRPSPMGSTTWPTTRGGSVSATPPPSP
jgi:hypothetical protein